MRRTMLEGGRKMMKLQPSLAHFEELAKTTNIIAVTAEVSMDLDKPVSVYCKLVGEAEGFILEYVDIRSLAPSRSSVCRSSRAG